jgi:hypothetical protein
MSISPGLPTLPKLLLERIQSWEYDDMRIYYPHPATMIQLYELVACLAFLAIPRMWDHLFKEVANILQYTVGVRVSQCTWWQIVAKHPSVIRELLVPIIKASQPYIQWNVLNEHLKETILQLTQHIGVSIDETLHGDFMAIMEELNDQVWEKNTEVTFQGMFWSAAISIQVGRQSANEMAPINFSLISSKRSSLQLWSNVQVYIMVPVYSVQA